MSVVKEIELFFQEGNSDKVYNATIVKNPDGTYDVPVAWGRRGGGLSQGKKAVKASLAVAEAAFDKVVREKRTKGYEEITTKVKPAAVAPPEGKGSGSKAGGSKRKAVGQAAQLLNPIEDDEVEGMLSDEDIVAQQKVDGDRLLVHVTEAEIVGTNRKGQVKKVPRAVLEALDSAPTGTVVDGELVTDGGPAAFWAFDLLQHGDDDLRARPYTERYEALAALCADLVGPVKLLPLASTEDEKRELFEALQEKGTEGIVFKRADAPYKAGRPASGGTQLKYKFIKSADVFITENAGNAYQMAVFEGKKRRLIGKVFAGTDNRVRKLLDATIADGETPVAEVQYLYATDDSQLFQAVFVRLREDKTPAECTFDQLLQTNRAVHLPVKKPSKKSAAAKTTRKKK
jgi:bifunctional non-homologous end joining protein LigD